MPRKRRYSTEQIITKLREADVMLSQEKTAEEISRVLEISKQTYYRWRKEYRGLNMTQAKKLKELEKENARLKTLVADLSLDNAIIKEVLSKKIASPDRRRQAVKQVIDAMDVSERRACRAIQQPRSTQRYPKVIPGDEELIRSKVIELASQYGRYGYRRVTALLRNQGWIINHKRIERIWREEGLKVPQKQPKRGRLWLNDGSVIRLRPEFPKHVWSYDFMHDRTHNGVPYRILNVIDEYTRECLAVKVARSLTHKDVIESLTDLFLERGVPVHIRSDNGSEFTAKKLREYLARLEIKPLFIEPGSPWENGYVESFNGKMRDELLAGEIFYSITEAQVIIEQWRWHYNQIRPHSSLGYKPPTPATFIPHTSQLQPAGVT
ncbi:MAG: IS3 family transposase [Chloroflexi bacterium]|nr:IS3 family transposase [Chloroflexota bacterium]MBT4754243.1 IS3 family transposase [Chloroflexota bacterium]MBT5335727.1 IS3 family transposase [Chloroflexota bacterium]MBT6152153.1 IS3 family transposase [Chloroflexota bacterium]MBT6357067.1 IS3 family transposase [Chloroflexota bacterium]